MCSKQKLQDTISLINSRLNRANRLTTALAEEEMKWATMIEDLSSELWTVAGDVLLTAASISYFGPMQQSQRLDVMQQWLSACDENCISHRENFRYL